MKSLWISLVIAVVPFAVFANSGSKLKSAEYYEFESWRGEYPNGYELRTSVRVPTVVSPSNAKSGPDCELKAKSVIHPWARKTESEFQTQSPVTSLVAKANVTLGGQKLKKGDKFKELTYLSEGFCRFLVNGTEVDDSCVFNADDQRATIEYTSPFPARELFKTTCANGKKAWIEARELELLAAEKEMPSVVSAEIIDFGQVKEP